jgi:hypothetical protein
MRNPLVAARLPSRARLSPPPVSRALVLVVFAPPVTRVACLGEPSLVLVAQVAVVLTRATSARC